MSATASARPGGDIPRPVLVAAATLIGLTIVLTLYTRVSELGVTQLVETRPVETLSLRFLDRADCAIEARDATSDRLVYLVRPGADGFIRGAVRGLAQARLRAGVGAAEPFRLARWRDGTLSLEDDATGRRIELDAFGPANAGAFAQFLGEPLQ